MSEHERSILFEAWGKRAREREAIREAAAALVAKLDEIHADPKYSSVWFSAQLHQGAYDGPTYEAELDVLKKALKEAG